MVHSSYQNPNQAILIIGVEGYNQNPNSLMVSHDGSHQELLSGVGCYLYRNIAVFTWVDAHCNKT